MHGDARTAATEARPSRLTYRHEGPQPRTALQARQTSGTSLSDDARLRDAVRALLSAIDALP